MASQGIRDVEDAVTANDTAFDTRIADGTANRLDASAAYDFNIERHQFLDNGTFIGNIADTTALSDLAAKMQVTASAGDEHVFGSREKIRYVPNYELLWGIAGWAESELTEGQHFALEFSNDTASDGYRYHFEGTADGPTLTAEQLSAGVPVDTHTADLAALEKHGYDHTQPAVARNFLNWYGAGLSRYELSFPVRDETSAVSEQRNVTIGRTANDSDVATEEINLRVQCRVWCDAGAADLTVNICSLGALIRGNATEFDRDKPATFWDVGGTISQYPVDNVDDAIAARIDPARDNTVVKIRPPVFSPAGSGVTMSVLVGAVQKDHADLTVNFDDPDDDGTNEGPAPAAQARKQTDVMQYTRDVTSIPTTTDIRADGTEGLVPDLRNLSASISEGGTQNSAASQASGDGGALKRIINPDDVVILLPRTNPTGSTTNGTIKFLKFTTAQDW